MTSQNPGIFREFAADFDVEFHEIDVYAGATLPDPAGFDGLWVMGGSMHVWEEQDFPWLIEEKSIIQAAIRQLELPFLGICLGHQLAAEALGGQVTCATNPEIGNFKIYPTDEGSNHPFLAGLVDTISWANVHTAEVSVAPPGSTIIARSNRCGNHVMQLAPRAYSMQFHPEVCTTTLPDWLEIPDILPFFEQMLGRDGFETFKTEIERHRVQNNLAARRLFENWLSLVF